MIAGGPKTIYEPWDVFSGDPLDPWGVDVAVTGEEYVLLSLLEVLLSIRADDESLRTTFMRARNSGMLDDIPGLVYAGTDREGVAEELVDTGIQRLLGDLDELPHQARLLRKAGAVSLQVLMITPATGSKMYAEAFTSGLAYESAGGRRVESHMIDANYVVASEHKQPWKKQLNIMAAYLYFYNPLRFLLALVRPKSKLYLADAGMQLLGMWGLMQTIRRTLGWAIRLMRGNIQRKTTVPASRIPMRGADGAPASHALPGTPPAELVQLTMKSPAATRAD